MGIKLWGVACLLLGGGATRAQDAHFTQQYANKLLLNPAFVGSQAEMSAVLTHRNQWPMLSGGFQTNQLSADYRFEDRPSALGLVVSLDQAGRAGFSRFQVGGIYAHHVQLGANLSLSGALQATYGSHRLDFSALVFGDQMDDNGGVQNTTQEHYVYEPVSYLSLGTGLLLYNNNFWAGVSAFHLNRPNIGFASQSALPLKIVTNLGYRFVLNSYYDNNRLHEFSLTPTVTYSQQEQFRKIDVGLYTTYSPMTLGILYRGWEMGGQTGFDRTLACIVGVEIQSFKAGYSYDYTLAGFGAGTGGAHELSLTFEKVDYDKLFKKRNSRKNYNQIPCPGF